jgi:hypothetical protein
VVELFGAYPPSLDCHPMGLIRESQLKMKALRRIDVLPTADSKHNENQKETKAVVKDSKASRKSASDYSLFILVSYSLQFLPC